MGHLIKEDRRFTAPAHAGPADVDRVAAIRFESVGLSLGGVPIFDNLDFIVEEGAFVCILGPSGCGKSTTLRLIGDLLTAGAGSVSVAGQSPREAWSRIAYVFQSPRLVPWRTALENVALGAELRFGRGDRRTRSERLERARELLAMVGLEQDGHKYPYALSGGERQRVAIARALAVDPDIILMDEPFSALDPATRRRLRDEIVDIWRRTGKTILFVTHDVDEALTVAEKIIVLSAKPTRIVETISVARDPPRQPETSPALRRQRDHLLDLLGHSRAKTEEETEQ